MSRVAFHSLDTDSILRRLQEYARALAEREEILAVVLFGSLVDGRALPGSDADLLVVVEESQSPFSERSLGLPAPRVGVPVDLFVYTGVEMESMVLGRYGVGATAVQSGATLFLRSGYHLPERLTGSADSERQPGPSDRRSDRR
jgi:predicted nucleotidyltransferase